MLSFVTRRKKMSSLTDEAAHNIGQWKPLDIRNNFKRLTRNKKSILIKLLFSTWLRNALYIRNILISQAKGWVQSKKKHWLDNEQIKYFEPHQTTPLISWAFYFSWVLIVSVCDRNILYFSFKFWWVSDILFLSPKLNNEIVLTHSGRISPVALPQTQAR